MEKQKVAALGEIAIRQTELFRRVKEDTLDPEVVLRGLQQIIEGQEVGLPVAKKGPTTDKPTKKELESATRLLALAALNGNMGPIYALIDSHASVSGVGEIKKIEFYFSESGEVIVPLRDKNGSPYITEIQWEKARKCLEEEELRSVGYIYDKAILTIFCDTMGISKTVGKDVHQAIKEAHELQKCQSVR